MKRGGKGRILHVDDEPLVLESMLILLRAEGYEVTGATNGAEASQLASGGFHPDVLIVDLHLRHQMNGAEVVEQIGKTLNYTPSVIMLTGTVADAKFPRLTAVNVWLTRKPLNPRLLLAALPNLVELSRATRTLDARR